MVTSSIPGEGKTTLAVNLAVALAESGLSVTLVEADLRRPQVTRYLGLVEGAGLTDVLTGRASLDDVVQEAGTERLQVLPSGPIPPNPSELLASEAMAALVRQLEADRGIVLIDVPPTLPVADASAMAGLVDGVILCARWGSVTTDELERSAAMLDRLGARVLGLVLTMVPGRATPVSYGYEAESRTQPGAPSLLGRIFRPRQPRGRAAARSTRASAVRRRAAQRWPRQAGGQRELGRAGVVRRQSPPRPTTEDHPRAVPPSVTPAAALGVDASGLGVDRLQPRDVRALRVERLERLTSTVPQRPGRPRERLGRRRP